MRLYFLVLGLDDVERDELLKFIEHPDLLHLRAALMEVANPAPPKWWEQPPPYDCYSTHPDTTTEVYTAPPPEGVLYRKMKIVWKMRVTAWRGEWLCVNASPSMWIRAVECRAA